MHEISDSINHRTTGGMYPPSYANCQDRGRFQNMSEDVKTMRQYEKFYPYSKLLIALGSLSMCVAMLAILVIPVILLSTDYGGQVMKRGYDEYTTSILLTTVPFVLLFAVIGSCLLRCGCSARGVHEILQRVPQSLQRPPPVIPVRVPGGYFVPAPAPGCGDAFDAPQVEEFRGGFPEPPPEYVDVIPGQLRRPSGPAAAVNAGGQGEPHAEQPAVLPTTPPVEVTTANAMHRNNTTGQLPAQA